jgi:hypothetical protein
MEALHADKSEAERALLAIASELGIKVDAKPTSEEEIDAFVAAPIASVCVRAVFRGIACEAERSPQISRERFVELLKDSAEVAKVQERTGFSIKDAALSLFLTGHALLDAGFFRQPREIAVRGRRHVVHATTSGLLVGSLSAGRAEKQAAGPTLRQLTAGTTSE